MQREPREHTLTSYEQKFITCSTYVETWLKRIMLVLLTFLIIIQSMLLIPEIRQNLSRIEPVEGVPYSTSTFSRDSLSGGK